MTSLPRIGLVLCAAAALTASPPLVEAGTAPSTLSLSSTPNPSTQGQNVTFVAQVSPMGATGLVTFIVGGSFMGSKTVNATTGYATLDTADLAPGNHDAFALYSGDAVYAAANSTLHWHAVTSSSTATATVVSSSPNPSGFGEQATFTATVTPAAATGAVSFYAAGVSLGSANLSMGANATRVASVVSSALGVGNHTILALYFGDGTYLPSNGSTSHAVINGASSVALTSSKNPLTAGGQTVFTATVTPLSATGTMTFRDGALTLGVVPLANGSAWLATANLSLGNHSIRAQYSGDSNYAGCFSNFVYQLVVPQPSVSIGDAVAQEGNGGNATLPFPVTLSAASSEPVTVTYNATPLTASPGADFLPTVGTLTFDPGQTAKLAHVPLVGDTLNERPETLTMKLSNPSGATLSTSTATGTIRDDEDEIVEIDGDTRSDPAVFHAASGLWFLRNSSDGALTALGFGRTGYTPVAADYDGDGITDVAVYHPPSGLWFVRNSSTLTTTTTGFGGPGYAPVRGDFDGDGRTDLAVFHEASGLWFVMSSSTGLVTTVDYGSAGYVPVPGDYDGDGKTDIAVYHPPSGLWFVRSSSTLATTATGFGGPGYAPVRGDFDGDGKTDHAVFHASSGLWFIKNSADGTVTTLGFGGAAYVPVVGKYDADGKADIAVYHEPSGLWYWKNSTNGVTSSAGFGGTGYAPVN